MLRASARAKIEWSHQLRIVNTTADTTIVIQHDIKPSLNRQRQKLKVYKASFDLTGECDK